MKKCLIFFCVLAMLMLFASCAKEEHEYFGEIYGKIIDSDTEMPISNASITLSPGGDTWLTGSDGHYEFTNMDPALQYTISVQHANYKSDKKDVTVKVGERALINFLLASE